MTQNVIFTVQNEMEILCEPGKETEYVASICHGEEEPSPSLCKYDAALSSPKISVVLTHFVAS